MGFSFIAIGIYVLYYSTKGCTGLCWIRSSHDVEHLRLLGLYPGSKQDKVNFCSSQEVHRQDLEVILYNLISLLGQGKRVSCGKKWFLLVE